MAVHQWRASAIKFRAENVDPSRMHLQRCPYDGTPLDVESYSGGSYLLTCESCSAAWEAHNSLVRRTAEPNWEQAAAARTARANSIRWERATPAS